VNLHEAIRDAFTVEYLMTPRERLQTASECPAPQSDPCYDVIPKTVGERIVGLWVIRDGEYVSEPLTEEWMLAHSTPIREVIRLFSATDAKPAYLVVNGARVDGIVSPADLNKVACRTYLFTLIGELEYWLGKLIRHSLLDERLPEEKVLQWLRPSRRQKVLERYCQMQSENADLGYVDALTFCDIVEVIARMPRLREKLGFSSTRHAREELDGLEGLRNGIAHPIRRIHPVIKTEKVCQQVEQAEKILKKIRDCFPTYVPHAERIA
jgi:hypothetical protein